ncbi:hypothetical protein L1887_49676 [Cichorium endivia]|nr:hypothetical protein L1887_49676 [Cichorium endivia]
MYMQGREQPYASRSRATLPLLELHKTLRLNWAMGVNNVANLFTPQGDADPLALLPCMVGVWQSAKPHDCETLLAAVSTAARYAAGLNSSYADAEVWADLTLLDGASAVQDACGSSVGIDDLASLIGVLEQVDVRMCHLVRLTDFAREQFAAHFVEHGLSLLVGDATPQLRLDGAGRDAVDANAFVG